MASSSMPAFCRTQRVYIACRNTSATMYCCGTWHADATLEETVDERGGSECEQAEFGAGQPHPLDGGGRATARAGVRARTRRGLGASTTRISPRARNWPAGARSSSTCPATASATGPRTSATRWRTTPTRWRPHWTRRGSRGAELVAHSMGGAVAIVLAHRRPDLVVPAGRSPRPTSTAPAARPRAAAASPRTARTSSSTAAATRACWTGRARLWAATMRLADPRALHRSAVGLRPRTRAHDARDADGLTTSSASISRASSAVNSPGRDDAGGRRRAGGDGPGAGHNVMFDNPDAFVRAVAGRPEVGLSPGGRPVRGSGRPRPRTTSCASPNRPAGGGGWARRAGRPG